MQICSAWLGFFLALSCLSSDMVRAEEKINYLVVGDVAKPFQIEKDEMSENGIITDIVDEIFQDSEYQVTPRVYPLTRLHHEVSKRLVSNWISYDAKLWNAFGEQGVLIDIPLFDVTHDLLTCDKSIQRIDSDADLNGMTLATLADFQYLQLDDLAKAGKVKLMPVSSYESGIMMSTLGRVNGFVEMSVRLKYNIATSGEIAPCQRYVDFSEIIPPYAIYLAVDHEMPANIKQFITQRVTDMKRAGDLAAIFNRWNKQ